VWFENNFTSVSSAKCREWDRLPACRTTLQRQAGSLFHVRSKPMMSTRTEELINAILDGEASEQDVAELQSLIGGDTELAGQLADRIAEHRLLGLIHQPFDSAMYVDSVMDAIASDERAVADTIFDKIQERRVVEVVKLPSANPAGKSPADLGSLTRSTTGSHPDRSKFKAGLWAGLAMSLVIAAGVWFLRDRFAGDRRVDYVPIATPSDAKSASPVATLLLEEDCVWGSETGWEEGHRLAPARVELESGSAVLRFDGGAELVMVGPAEIELKSAASVLVRFGDVVVRATDGAEGFVVTTPTSEVVDLGTEFAVKVNRSGGTEVHVLDGEVRYRKLGASDELAKILRAGEGIAIDKRGRPRAIPMNSPRFKDFVNRINPRSRADLLTAYEGFNYSPGVLPLEQSTVGIGWKGPWRRRLPKERRRPSQDASPQELEIVHGQMNVTWPVPGGRLGMLKLPPGSIFYVRPLRKAIDLGRDGVTYFSLMVREIERPTNRKQPYEHLRLTFRSSGDYFGDALSFGHGPGYRPRIQAGDGKLYTSPLEFPAEQTTLWIGKVVSRVHGEDEVYFRIYGEDEALDYAEPATWHVVTRDADSDARLDRVLLSSTGKFGRIVDELRIGPTWRSVAPMSEERE